MTIGQKSFILFTIWSLLFGWSIFFWSKYAPIAPGLSAEQQKIKNYYNCIIRAMDYGKGELFNNCNLLK